MNTSLSYQLGTYIGEYVVRQYLPTLSCEAGYTNNVIKVSDEDSENLKKAEDKWFISYRKDPTSPIADSNWKVYRKLAHELQKKYLPAKLVCNISTLHNVESTKDLKEGIRDALWDCDVCCYKIEKDSDINITMDKFGAQQLILTLNEYD